MLGGEPAQMAVVSVQCLQSLWRSNQFWWTVRQLMCEAGQVSTTLLSVGERLNQVPVLYHQTSGIRKYIIPDVDDSSRNY